MVGGSETKYKNKRQMDHLRVLRALVVVGEVKKSFETKDNACRQVPKEAQVPWERQFFLQRSVGG